MKARNLWRGWLVTVSLSLGIFTVPAFAQQPAPNDPLPVIQVAVELGKEVARLCAERFPDIGPQVEQKLNAWPLGKITIQILVNGKEYISPFIQGLVSQVRDGFYRDDESTSKTGCEEIDKVFNSLTKGVSPEVLESLLPGSDKPH